MVWTEILPATLQLANADIFACYGSLAGGDLDYLLADVGSGRAILASGHAIRPPLDGTNHARLVRCGHTHMPRMVRIDDVMVVNPGNIGVPAYTDNKPVPNAIKTGSPHVQYAVVTRGLEGRWSAELRAVAYDWDRTTKQAQEHG